MTFSLSHVHEITVNTKIRSTSSWLIHENCGKGNLRQVFRYPFTWMQCRNCGWEFMWSENDENLVSCSSPIRTAVFYKPDDVFIFRDIEGDYRDELTFDKMRQKRGPSRLIAENCFTIQINQKQVKDFGRIFIEDINLYHQNCSSINNKFFPYFFCTGCNMQFEVSDRKDILAIYKTAFEGTMNTVKTTGNKIIYKQYKE
jgi:hypothetical protein